MKRLIIFISGFVIFLTLNIEQTKGQSFNGLPEVTFPSPEAAALFKYMEYPVDYYTGVPNINIPIYEVRSGQLSVPISISYHASGRKVYDETGAIGLGWTLNAGGMIARSVYGFPDDDDSTTKFPSPWISSSNIKPDSNYYYLAGADRRDAFYAYNSVIPSPGYKSYDTQYDIFSYVFNSVSGKFVFKDSCNIKIPVFLPKVPYKIIKHSNTSGYHHYFDYIEILDDKGVLYHFGKSITDTSEYIETSNSGSSHSYNTGWLLSEIISADKTDTISFKYRTFSRVKQTLFQEQGLRVYDNDVYMPWGYPAPNSEFIPIDRGQDELLSIERLTEIKFKHGKIIFNLDKDQYNNDIDQIKSIQILDDSNDSIKKIELYRSYLDAVNAHHYDIGTANYKLDSVIFKDNGLKKIEKYRFEYYPTVTSIDAAAQDFWGYHNGASGDNSLVPFVPTYEYTFQHNQYSDRTSDLASMECGVLKKIVYPTLGSTEFIYQANEYIDNTGHTTDCGGLRISEIKTGDNNGNTQIKTYEYGTNRCGYGALLFTPSSQNMTYSVSYYGLSDASKMSVATGWTETYGSCNVLPIYGFFMQNPVYYPEITEYYGTETINTGKTIYKYNFPNNSSIGYFGPNVDYNYWDKSTLTDIVNFKSRISSGLVYYDTVKWVSNSYSKTSNNNETLKGLWLKRLTVVTPDGVWEGNSPDSCQWVYPDTTFWGPCWYYRRGDSFEKAWASHNNKNIYQFFDYTVSVGKTENTAIYEKDYTDNGIITNVKYFTYNQQNLLSRTKQIENINDSLVTQTKYPFDFLPNTVYNSMISRNMLNYPIEQSNYKNSSLVESGKTVYRDLGNNLIVPDSVYRKEGTNPYELLLKYHAYDISGNILQYQKANDNNVSFIWGYKNSFPIAKVVNSDKTNIYFTSFEDETGTTFTDQSGKNLARSGDKVLNNGSFSFIGKFSPTDPSGLLMSYWYWNGSKWLFSGNLSYSSTITTSWQKLDDIRVFPANAEMTTYTYEPLIGITSITDANSITTYFEYDSFGRLKCTKDQNGNIIKAYDYHYHN